MPNNYESEITQMVSEIIEVPVEKLKPDADYAYYHRGIVYRILDDHQWAIADFKKTLKLTKNSKRRQDAEKQLQELGAR